MEIKILFSSQAKLLLNEMPNLNKKDLVNWYCNIKKIEIGGGDIVEYLEYKKKVK